MHIAHAMQALHATERHDTFFKDCIACTISANRGLWLEVQAHMCDVLASVLMVMSTACFLSFQIFWLGELFYRRLCMFALTSIRRVCHRHFFGAMVRHRNSLCSFDVSESWCCFGYMPRIP